MPRYRVLPAMLIALTISVTACGGGGDSATSTPPAAPTAATTAAAPTLNATEIARATAAPPGSTLERTPSGREFDAARAKALIDTASLTAADLGADWAITSDQLTDNAAAAASDPTGAPSFERCGRLLGRTVTSSPGDTVSAYLTGLLVAAFSQITVYKTADGAADCAAEGATRFQQPGQLARAFGTVFLNPDAVTVQPLDYPLVADGSFAAALTGDINAAGTTVQLQIVVVAFRKGNTSAVVGVAMSPLTNPSTAELKPYVDLVLQRITSGQ